jgi:hypothetical protein
VAWGGEAVVNVTSVDAAVPSGAVATRRAWYALAGERPVSVADVAWAPAGRAGRVLVEGVVEQLYGLGAGIDLGQPTAVPERTDPRLFRPAGRLIVSPSEASMIAWRSDPVLESLVFITVTAPADAGGAPAANAPPATHAAADRRRRIVPRFRPLTPFPRAHRAPAQLGHAAGDELLTAIAGRLGNCVRPTHTLIRIGDAGFAILLEQAASRDEAIDLAERINRRLAERFSVAGQSMSVRASTGSPTDECRDHRGG